MSILEFDVIKQYFSKITSTKNSSKIPLAIGDDAAIVASSQNKALVICTDTLNEAIHFPVNTSAYHIGYKALAVNLSDLAAMGAKPEWFTLNVSLPDIDEKWIASFSEGLAELASCYKLDLIGGDTTRGPLSVTITLAGYLEVGQALMRSNACVGDKIYLTGCTGEAAYGLSCIQNDKVSSPDNAYFIERLNKPTAHVELGMALVDIANACIDVSDGLLADVLHLSEASEKGIQIDLNSIPLPDIEDSTQAQKFALSGGDDYELVFTIAEENIPEMETRIQSINKNLAVTCIGRVVEGEGLQVFENNKRIDISSKGYQHFK